VLKILGVIVGVAIVILIAAWLKLRGPDILFATLAERNRAPAADRKSAALRRACGGLFEHAPEVEAHVK